MENRVVRTAIISAVLVAVLLFGLGLKHAGTMLAKAEDTQKSGMEFGSKSAYLIDMGTGTELYAKNADEKRPIASMVKIMTLVLCLEEVEKGNIKIEDKVQISENAASMGGSQAFLDAGSEYTVDELIKTITIASANDSCVAMAELIAGSVETFVERMNARAGEYGMADTVFANCTGLPAPNQHSTARDVSKMMRQLARHDLYYKYSKIWMDKLVHGGGRETELANTNKLIRFYDGCDGGKTGFTNDAMFCLAATAKRGDLRLISVIMGGSDSKIRFADSSKLLNYGFATYENKQVIEAGKPIESAAPVQRGKQPNVVIAPNESFSVFGLKGAAKKNVELREEIFELQAPIAQGQEAGRIVIIKDGEQIGEVKLIATMAVERKSYNDYLKSLFKRFANSKEHIHKEQAS